MHRRGLFVTVDGPSGVGKSTTVGLLSERLRSVGYPTHTTTEPSGDAIGRLARDKVDKIAGPALACLLAADRYDHLNTNTLPRLDAGETVIQDRYLASALVMQRLDDVEIEFLSVLNIYAHVPDLSVILTADPGVIAKRLARRGAHNRYQHAPGSSHLEWRLFGEAADHLDQHGRPVLRVDTTDTRPTVVADRLLAGIRTLTPETPAPQPSPGRGSAMRMRSSSVRKRDRPEA